MSVAFAETAVATSIDVLISCAAQVVTTPLFDDYGTSHRLSAQSERSNWMQQTKVGVRGMVKNWALRQWERTAYRFDVYEAITIFHAVSRNKQTAYGKKIKTAMVR